MYIGLEDLDVYNQARAFRRRIYELIKGLPPEEKYNLAAQMRRPWKISLSRKYVTTQVDRLKAEGF